MVLLLLALANSAFCYGFVHFKLCKYLATFSFDLQFVIQYVPVALNEVSSFLLFLSYRFSTFSISYCFASFFSSTHFNKVP